MSWSIFAIAIASLITIAVLFVAFPWLVKRNIHQRDALNNVQIVKQRITELERECAEGLISEQDKQQAIAETKLALVEEGGNDALQEPGSPSVGDNGLKRLHSSALVPLFVGGFIALASGIVVYQQVNHIDALEQAHQAVTSLDELSTKLSENGGRDVTREDVAHLALAIRERLRSSPEDDKGWMYLGRLLLSLGQDSQAIEAIDKAVALKPTDRTINITLAQALMATGEENNIIRAQRLLAALLRGTPDNNNLALMMAVASAQLGDLSNTEKYYQQVAPMLPDGNDMKVRLEQRIAELKQQFADVSAPIANQQQGQQNPQANDVAARDATTGFDLTIELAAGLSDKLPPNGYLIVFAQDAMSDNRMPAAVVKLPLAELPLSLSLTTANAMLPNYSLAQLQQARLVARISPDENVAISPGELQGSVVMSVVSGQRQTQIITIDEVL